MSERSLVTSLHQGISLSTITTSRGERVRLACIQAPGVRGGSRPEDLVSRDYLKDLILEKEVQLLRYDFDRFNRLEQGGLLRTSSLDTALPIKAST